MEAIHQAQPNLRYCQIIGNVVTTPRNDPYYVTDHEFETKLVEYCRKFDIPIPHAIHELHVREEDI